MRLQSRLSRPRLGVKAGRGFHQVPSPWAGRLGTCWDDFSLGRDGGTAGRPGTSGPHRQPLGPGILESGGQPVLAGTTWASRGKCGGWDLRNEALLGEKGAGQKALRGRKAGVPGLSGKEPAVGRSCQPPFRTSLQDGRLGSCNFHFESRMSRGRLAGSVQGAWDS